MIVKYIKSLDLKSMSLVKQNIVIGELHKSYTIELADGIGGTIRLYLNTLYHLDLLKWLRDNLKDGEQIVL